MAKLNKSETKLLAQLRDDDRTHGAQTQAGENRKFRAARSLADRGLVTIKHKDSSRVMVRDRMGYHGVNITVIAFELTEAGRELS